MVSRINWFTISTFIQTFKGWSWVNSPRKLNPEAKAALETVEQAITNRQVHQICLEVCISVFILIVNFHPTGIIEQWNSHWTYPLHILEWMFLSHQPKKMAPTIFELSEQLIIKCCHRYLQLNARDPSKIIIHVTQEQFEWCFANCTALQSALQDFSGQITYHLPGHRLLKLSGETALSVKPLNSHTPLKGVSVDRWLWENRKSHCNMERGRLLADTKALWEWITSNSRAMGCSYGFSTFPPHSSKRGNWFCICNWHTTKIRPSIIKISW